MNLDQVGSSYCMKPTIIHYLWSPTHKTQNHNVFAIFGCQKKAFDRLAWRFPTASLEQISLRLSFIQMMALYACPTARIKVNSLLSDHVPISNGMRQGCPFFPLIYIIAREDLATVLMLPYKDKWHTLSLCWRLGLYVEPANHFSFHHTRAGTLWFSQ